MTKQAVAEVENDATDEAAATVSTPAPLKRKFADHDILVPVAFTNGQALTAAQAAWASSQLATVLGNQFGGALRRLKEAAETAGDGQAAAQAKLASFDAQAEFDALYASYAFGVRGDGSASGSDPVSRLVRTLATEAVKGLIVAKGLKVRDFQTTKIGEGDEAVSKFDTLVGQYMEQHPELEETAKAQLEALANAETSGLDISL